MNSRHITTPELAERLTIDVRPSAVAQIDVSKVEAVATRIRERRDFGQLTRAKWDDPRCWNVEDSPTERSQYFSIGNSINFRYWRLREGRVETVRGVKGGEEFRGALYMWRCLRVAVDTKSFPILDASALATLSSEEFDLIFKSDDGRRPLDIAKDDRIENLRDLGGKLTRKWSGKFFNVVIAANGSLARFIELSRQFRAFDDPLLKLTMVNTILHLGSGIARFDGDPLPGIDYQLVKQLARIGVLLPAKSIAEALTTGRHLNGEEAFELRRAALAAFISLSRLTGISGEILDNRWWENRVNCLDEKPVCVDPQTAGRCPFYGVCDQKVAFKMPLEETRYY